MITRYFCCHFAHVARNSTVHLQQRKNLKKIDADLLNRLEEFKKRFAPFKNRGSLFLVPPTMNDNREIQWAESRRCLLDVLCFFKEESNNIHVSVSHTDLYSVAIGCQSENIRGVGVDIERIDRQVSEKAALKFVTKSEIKLGLTPLEIWVIKEACYKADTSRKAQVISQYECLTYDSRSREGSVGLVSDQIPIFKFMLLRTDELMCGVALNFKPLKPA